VTREGSSVPIVDNRDVLDAVFTIGRAGSETLSAKRWIVYRATILGAKTSVPKEWIKEVGEAVRA
jgi:hypothetical protein